MASIARPPVIHTLLAIERGAFLHGPSGNWDDWYAALLLVPVDAFDEPRPPWTVEGEDHGQTFKALICAVRINRREGGAWLPCEIRALRADDGTLRPTLHVDAAGATRDQIERLEQG